MLLLTAPTLQAQNVWSNLKRSTFDTTESVLRVPCVTLQDAAGKPLTGFAPSYALNLALVGEVLELVEPIAAFATTPDVCLDTLQLSADESMVIYDTESAQVDADFLAGVSRFYNLRLEANLNSANPTQFALLSESSRLYQRAIWSGSVFDLAVTSPDVIFDAVALNEAEAELYSQLTVFEPGTYSVKCEYFDPFDLLEVFEVVGDNVRSRLRSNVTSDRNGESVAMDCTVTNRQLNFVDIEVNAYKLIKLAL